MSDEPIEDVEYPDPTSTWQVTRKAKTTGRSSLLKPGGGQNAGVTFAIHWTVGEGTAQISTTRRDDLRAEDLRLVADLAAEVADELDAESEARSDAEQ